jgi:hypothetical protein
MGKPLFLVLLAPLAVCAAASCSTSSTMGGPDEGQPDATSGGDAASDVSTAETGGDSAFDGGRAGADDAASDALVDAPDSADGDGPGNACPNTFDVGRPDAGGVCCCNYDVGATPLCEADGGSPSCPSGFGLHHDQECDPSSAGSPCTNPPGNVDAGVDAPPG